MKKNILGTLIFTYHGIYFDYYFSQSGYKAFLQQLYICKGYGYVV